LHKIKIKWTAFASKELDNISNYIAKESQSDEIALEFIKSIFQRTEQLELMPQSGQLEPHLKEFKVRYILESNYKIHYKYENNTVIITDIFHTKRNPGRMKK